MKYISCIVLFVLIAGTAQGQDSSEKTTKYDSLFNISVWLDLTKRETDTDNGIGIGAMAFRISCIGFSCESMGGFIPDPDISTRPPHKNYTVVEFKTHGTSVSFHYHYEIVKDLFDIYAKLGWTMYSSKKIAFSNVTDLSYYYDAEKEETKIAYGAGIQFYPYKFIAIGASWSELTKFCVSIGAIFQIHDF